MKKTMTTLITIITILTIFSSASYAVDMRVIGSLRISEPRELDPERALYLPDSHMPANREDLRSYFNLPDFRITDVVMTKICWVEDPNTVILDIRVQVTNAGGDEGIDENTVVGVHMTPFNNSTQEPEDVSLVPEAEKFFTHDYIPAPKPGEFAWVDLGLTLQDTFQIDYLNQWLLAEFSVDKTDSIEEKNETNNTRLFYAPEEMEISDTCSN